jgi:hypothetical protein
MGLVGPRLQDLPALRLGLQQAPGDTMLLGKHEDIAQRRRSDRPSCGWSAACHAILSAVRISRAATERQMSHHCAISIAKRNKAIAPYALSEDQKAYLRV